MDFVVVIVGFEVVDGLLPVGRKDIARIALKALIDLQLYSALAIECRYRTL